MKHDKLFRSSQRKQRERQFVDALSLWRTSFGSSPTALMLRDQFVVILAQYVVRGTSNMNIIDVFEYYVDYASSTNCSTRPLDARVWNF